VRDELNVLRPKLDSSLVGVVQLGQVRERGVSLVNEGVGSVLVALLLLVVELQGNPLHLL